MVMMLLALYSEALSEDPTFLEKELAALLAAKVYSEPSEKTPLVAVVSTR
jgi:hypothetical protein